MSARPTSATPSASSTTSPAETAQPLTFTVECDGTELDDYHEFWSLTKELDLSPAFTIRLDILTFFSSRV